MSIEITDLDELLGADKQVRLQGRVWALPPDLPAELYLRIQRLARSGADEVTMVETLYDELLGLFRYKDPKLESLPISLQQCMLTISTVYGSEDGEQQEQTLPPPPSRAGGATKTGRATKRTGSKR